MLAVVEHGGELRVLPANADLGCPGLWERLDAAGEKWFDDMRADLPDSTDSGRYADMLRLAGFSVLADELLTLTLESPLDRPCSSLRPRLPAADALAAGTLRRLRLAAGGLLHAATVTATATSARTRAGCMMFMVS